jgi:hypothetical protein
LHPKHAYTIHNTMSDAPPAAPTEAQQPEGPSKNALKKAQKEKEKVELQAANWPRHGLMG